MFKRHRRRIGRSLSKRFVRMVPSKRPGIIQASYGRSGSTMVYEALASAMSQARFRMHFHDVRDESWTLGEKPLRCGIVYKTHDYPDALAGRDDLRTVFVFGAATETALSVIDQEEKRGRDWIDRHLSNLKAPGRYEDILNADILGIGAQLDAWTTFDQSPVLCLRYDGLWDNLDRLRDFTDLPVELPERRARAEKSAPTEIASAIARVYGPIDARLARLPDAFVAGPEFGFSSPVDKPVPDGG